MKWIKQLFCKHDWVLKAPLKTVEAVQVAIAAQSVGYCIYKCRKCGRQR